jgi:hypothetical protein
VSGRRDDALRLLDELSSPRESRYVSPARIGQVHLGLGDRAAALVWLDRAVDEQCAEVAWLGVHPMFDELRAEGKFLALLERIGLPAVSGAAELAGPPP